MKRKATPTNKTSIKTISYQLKMRYLTCDRGPKLHFGSSSCIMTNGVSQLNSQNILLFLYFKYEHLKLKDLMFLCGIETIHLVPLF